MVRRFPRGLELKKPENLNWPISAERKLAEKRKGNGLKHGLKPASAGNARRTIEGEMVVVGDGRTRLLAHHPRSGGGEGGPPWEVSIHWGDDKEGGRLRRENCAAIRVICRGGQGGNATKQSGWG